MLKYNYFVADIKISRIVVRILYGSGKRNFR